ncbi:DUF4326 domain-containing protein [Kribbella sp. NPDC051137]|uniref:DUF4326 domain-containing protein n=1 Tax=Kribbella sp. NPDC051137 TaxID=3155045 RepID=UPI0034456B41
MPCSAQKVETAPRGASSGHCAIARWTQGSMGSLAGTARASRPKCHHQAHPRSGWRRGHTAYETGWICPQGRPGDAHERGRRDCGLRCSKTGVPVGGCTARWSSTVRRGSGTRLQAILAEHQTQGVGLTDSEAAAIACDRYAAWLDGAGPARTQLSGTRQADRAWFREHLYELVGRPLACMCPVGSPCHRDVLLARSELARQSPGSTRALESSGSCAAYRCCRQPR